MASINNCRFSRAAPEEDGVYWVVPNNQNTFKSSEAKLVALVSRDKKRFVQYFKFDHHEQEVLLEYTDWLWGLRVTIADIKLRDTGTERIG